MRCVEWFRRRHLRWRMRVRRRLPELEARIKALDGLMYQGKGFHYEKRWQLYKAMRFLAAPADDHPCMRMVTEVVIEGLFADIAKAERSARTDCARYNR